MQVSTATLRIVTPMFIGDAEQKPSALPARAVKSALRFWWRATNWGSCMRDAKNDEALALQLLHREEGRLFGEAANGDNGGQGCCLFAITRQPKCSPLEESWPKQQNNSAYLAYGLLPTQETPHRHALLERVDNAANSFDLRMVFKKGTPDKDVAQILLSLKLLGTFGGLGSRWRRGFGSVALELLDGANHPAVEWESYEQQAHSLLTSSTRTSNYPPFTAFSAHQRLKLLATASSSRSVMEEVGKKYKDHRGPDSGLPFNQKMPFGLPLQGMKLQKDTRRASPLMLHVHPVASNKYVAVGLFLPATFHPDVRKRKEELPGFYRSVEDFVS